MSEPASVIVHAEYESLYDQVVQPDHIIGVPRYFIRHIPFLGVDLAWMYLAFRQSAYMLGARGGHRAGRFSGRRIASWSGICPRTFWNRVAKPDTWHKLNGLVRPVQEDELDDGEPNQYAVSMTLPLTAQDAASLEIWLARFADQYGAERALFAAANTPIDELFSLSTGNGKQPETVFTLVKRLYGNLISKTKLEQMMTRLHRHIMSQNERLEITHFFVRNVLPHIGTGPGLMLILLRDRARDEKQIHIDQGYAEIADWLGLNRPKTVWEWLNGFHTEKRSKKPRTNTENFRPGGRQRSLPGTLRNPILPFYVSDRKGTKTDKGFETASRTFEVSPDDIPLEFMEVPFGKDVDMGTLENWLLANSGSGSLAHFAHPVGALCTPLLAHFAVHIGALCTPLNTPLTSSSTSACAEVKKSADAEPGSEYPTRPRDAFDHPELDFYFRLTGWDVEQKEWAFVIDYVLDIRQKNPDLTDDELIQQGKGFYQEWLERNYSPTNPDWLTWWRSNNIPPRKPKQSRKPRQKVISPSKAPGSVQGEPEQETTVTPELLKLIEDNRQRLVEKGIMKPRAN